VHASSRSRTQVRARVAVFLAGFVLAGAIHVAPATAERLSPKLKVDKTRYRYGQEVRVKAERFDSKRLIDYTIKGLPGSCKADQVAFKGVVKSNREGNLDAIVYMVQWDDCGWYEITATEGRKEARPAKFRVKGPADATPEESPEDELFEADVFPD
jgi:hypothetical protein